MASAWSSCSFLSSAARKSRSVLSWKVVVGNVGSVACHLAVKIQGQPQFKSRVSCSSVCHVGHKDGGQSGAGLPDGHLGGARGASSGGKAPRHKGGGHEGARGPLKPGRQQRLPGAKAVPAGPCVTRLGTEAARHHPWVPVLLDFARHFPPAP